MMDGRSRKRNFALDQARRSVLNAGHAGGATGYSKWRRVRLRGLIEQEALGRGDGGPPWTAEGRTP